MKIFRESAEFPGCYVIHWEKNGKLWHACLLSSKNTERISVKETWNGVTKQFGSEKCPNSERFALEPHRDRSEGALRLSSSKILYPSGVQGKYLMFPQIQKIHLFHPWNKIKHVFFSFRCSTQKLPTYTIWKTCHGQFTVYMH